MQLTSEILYQSDTWNWSESLTDYPPSTHTLKCYLKKATGDTITLPAEEDDEDSSKHEFTVTAATTASYVGTYAYQFTVTNISTSEVTTIERGYIEVLPALSAASDERGYWAQTFATLQTAYTNMASREFAEIDLPGGKSVKYDRRQLLRELNIAKDNMIKERRIAKGQSAKRLHKVKLN